MGVFMQSFSHNYKSLARKYFLSTFYRKVVVLHLELRMFFMINSMPMNFSSPCFLRREFFSKLKLTEYKE